MIIKKLCEECGKVAEIEQDTRDPKTKIRYKKYKCGHYQLVYPLPNATNYDLDKIVSSDGKKPYPYQKDGAKFIIQADGRAAVLDEMGLGKTVQGLMPIKMFPDKFTPALIVVKSGLRLQWMKETLRWTGQLSQIIEGEKDFIIPGIKIFIISMDMLWRFGWDAAVKETTRIMGPKPKSKDKDALKHWKTQFDSQLFLAQPEAFSKLIERTQIKYLLLDEVQHMKNTDSKRTNAVRNLTRAVDKVVALSGTPIKNNAEEYFPVLNMLYPEKFPNRQRFISQWCDSYFNGYTNHTGGLKDPERFKEYTKDFIIRRTREEVLPDLPTISRENRFSDLSTEVQQAYDLLLDKFKNFYNTDRKSQSAFTAQNNILAYFAQMRHITGLSKIDPVVDLTEEFVTTTDRKLVIFLHHKDVAQLLMDRLRALQKDWPAEWGKEILEIKSEMDSKERNEQVEKFWQPGYRIMVASTLAAGEGLNLQCASDCIIMERQWNPANEEQAEARFLRIGQESKKVTATYMVAVGTIDEFLSELVEKKRSYVANTLDAKEYQWDESSLIKELAEMLANSGKSKWSY